MKLAEKRCVPCEGGVEPLSPEEAHELGTQVPDWEVREDRIEKTFQFDSYARTMEFANRVAAIAEEQNHHPDLHVSWGKVRVELSTHKIGGLSENDFIVAAKIDELV